MLRSGNRQRVGEAGGHWWWPPRQARWARPREWRWCSVWVCRLPAEPLDCRRKPSTTMPPVTAFCTVAASRSHEAPELRPQAEPVSSGPTSATEPNESTAMSMPSVKSVPFKGRDELPAGWCSRLRRASRKLYSSRAQASRRATPVIVSDGPGGSDAPLRLHGDSCSMTDAVARREVVGTRGRRWPGAKAGDITSGDDDLVVGIDAVGQHRTDGVRHARCRRGRRQR